MNSHEDWIKKSESDLSAAKVLFSNNSPILDICVYHCQQSAEKALKAFLIFKTGKFKKVHDGVICPKRRKVPLRVKSL